MDDAISTESIRIIGAGGDDLEAYLAVPTPVGDRGAVVLIHNGGRQTVLAACDVDVDGAVDCYGAFVLGEPPAGFPLQARGFADQLANLRCPLLGLSGNDDSYPAQTRWPSSTVFSKIPARTALDGYQRIAAFYDRTSN